MNFISFPNTLEILQNKGSLFLLHLISFQLNISSCFQHSGQQIKPLYFLPEGSRRNLNSICFYSSAVSEAPSHRVGDHHEWRHMSTE